MTEIDKTCEKKVTNTIIDGGSNMCKAFRIITQSAAIVTMIPSSDESSSPDCDEDLIVLEDETDEKIVRITDILDQENWCMYP